MSCFLNWFNRPFWSVDQAVQAGRRRYQVNNSVVMLRRRQDWLISRNVLEILHHMVKYQPPLDSVFSALSDPTRRAILAGLVDGQRTVGELAKPFDICPSGFSKHLRVLERAGLLRQNKQGRERHCEVLVEPIDDALSWLEQFRPMWNASLDSFAEYAERLQAKRRRAK